MQLCIHNFASNIILAGRVDATMQMVKLLEYKFTVSANELIIAT